MNKTMKKLMVVVLAVAAMVVLVAAEAKAATISKEELNVLTMEVEFEEEFKKGAADESVAFNRAVELDATHEEIGPGIYDIQLRFVFYKKHVYDAHFIYDAFEDDDLTEYGIIDGKRYDMEDWEDIIEAKFPELFV